MPKLDAFFAKRVPPSTHEAVDGPMEPNEVVVVKRAKVSTQPNQTMELDSSLVPGSVEWVLACLRRLEPSWHMLLATEFCKPYFKLLQDFLVAEISNGKKIFPPLPQIYSWSELTPIADVRVVILGQDPYHNDGQAMGLAFSVPSVMRPLPPSLTNIFQELATDEAVLATDGRRFRPPINGDLRAWARQGVLLLNTSLTVRAHEAASHANKGWEVRPSTPPLPPFSLFLALPSPSVGLHG